MNTGPDAAPDGVEIERKFLVADDWTVPPGAPSEPMRQAYLTVSSADPEVRIRQTPSGSLMTVKAMVAGGSGVAVVRTEIEFPISAEVFERLWSLPAAEALDKVRATVWAGAAEATVDTYSGTLAPLRVVEVEFPTLADAAAFTPPDWFGAEVTGQKPFGNRALAGRAAAAARAAAAGETGPA